MAGSPNGTGPRRKPGPRPAQINAPNMFCIFCCQLFKNKEQEQIMPAITMTVIFVANLPVAVPTCMDHLEVPKASSLIT